MTAYVWNGSEVQLTGRTARKEGKAPSGRTGRARQRIDILYEIEPTDKEDGSWKKWVRMNELYEIVDEPEQADDGEPAQESISSGEEGSCADGANSIEDKSTP